MRVRNVATAMARMPISGPYASGSFIIDERPDDAAGDRTDDDEPPARHQMRHNQRDDTRDGPADRAPGAAPQRHEHRGEEDQQYEIEAEPLGIGNEGAKQVAGDGRRHPHGPERKPRASEYRTVRTAFGAIAHRDQPGRIDGAVEGRVRLPLRQRTKPRP